VSIVDCQMRILDVVERLSCQSMTLLHSRVQPRHWQGQCIAVGNIDLCLQPLDLCRDFLTDILERLEL